MKSIRTIIALVTVGTALSACVSTAGLTAQAADDMSCEEDKLSTSKVKNGYAGDDFGAQFEVEGCGEKVVYEKKGPGSWAAVTEAESVD